MNNAPFIDMLMKSSGAKNMHQLSLDLKVSWSMLQKTSVNQRAVGATLILAAHEKLGIPVCEMRDILK